jgi:predicted SAM-dependent methyltransferase
VTAIPPLHKRYRMLALRWHKTKLGLRLRLWRFFQIADRKQDAEKLMVNIGSGIYYRRHWRTLDFPSAWYPYPDYMVSYKFDLTGGAPFPFEDDAVAFFFCSHTIEHIPQEFCQHIFNEVYRCLRPGGAFRITTPDFDKGYNAYARGDESYFDKYPGNCIEERFLNYFATYMQGRISPEEFRQRYDNMSKAEFADSFTSAIPRESQLEHNGNHINWWNFEKFEQMFKEAGFTEIYQSQAQQSRFPEMRGFGRLDGFDTTHPEISIFVEAIK